LTDHTCQANMTLVNFTNMYLIALCYDLDVSHDLSANLIMSI